MTYSYDFRRKVLSVREKEGLTIAQVAKRFFVGVASVGVASVGVASVGVASVGVASVVRWVKTPEPKRTRNKPATKINMDALAADIIKYPDAYQYERAERLGVSAKGIGHALRRMGITYKKSLDHPKAGADKRLSFQNLINSYKDENRTIVYIDESGFACDMPRTYGYALRGMRCYGVQDWHSKGRTNVIGALIHKTLLTIALFQTNINVDEVF